MRHAQRDWQSSYSDLFRGETSNNANIQPDNCIRRVEPQLRKFSFSPEGVQSVYMNLSNTLLPLPSASIASQPPPASNWESGWQPTTSYAQAS